MLFKSSLVVMLLVGLGSQPSFVFGQARVIEPPPAEAPPPTLYERMGGANAIGRIAGSTHRALALDAALRGRRLHSDAQLAIQQMLCFASNGPCRVILDPDHPESISGGVLAGIKISAVDEHVSTALKDEQGVSADDAKEFRHRLSAVLKQRPVSGSTD